TGKLADQPASEPKAAMLDWIASHGLLDPLQPTDDKPAKTLSSLLDQYHQIEKMIHPPMYSVASTEGGASDESIFIRGNPKTPGPVAHRRLLEAIAGPNQPLPARGSGRLELAMRITDPSNPFISRVMVNRVWHHLMGKGIVPSMD